MTEYRAVSGDVKLSTKDGLYTEIRGRACPYNVKADIGPYDEIIMPGCFTNSIQDSPRPLPLLLFHESGKTDHIIGHATAWEERKDGLYGTWSIDSSPDAQEAARRAEAGDLTGLSVGFVPVKHEVINNKAGNTVVRIECRLLEVSLTPTPAFKEGMVISVRSQSPQPAAKPGPLSPPKPASDRVGQARDRALRYVKDDSTRVLVGAKIGAWLREGGLAYARMMATETYQRGNLDFVTATIDTEDTKTRAEARLQARRALYELSRAELPRRRHRRLRTRA